MPPWLDGWGKRFATVIDADLIDEDLPWFPISLFLNAAAGITAQDLTPIFDEVGANKLKIAVTKADAVTQLYVEIDIWDEVAEEAVLHVSKSDLTIANATDTVLYIYFDATHADNTDYVGVTGSTPAKAVWNDAFVMVQHMNDDPDTSHIKDSTQYANNGTKKAANEPIEAAGTIGKAQSFDGVDDYIDCGNDSSLSITDAITIEGMVKANSYDVDDKELMSKGYAYRFVAVNTGGGTVLIHSYDAQDDSAVSKFDLSPWAAQWVHIAGILQGYSGSWTSRLFVNGEKKDEDTNINYGGPKSGSEHLLMMCLGSDYFNGIIDEVRISNVARSAAWIVATNLTLTDALIEWGTLQTLYECECSDVLVHTDTNAPTVTTDGACSDVMNQSDAEVINVESSTEVSDALQLHDTPLAFVLFLTTVIDIFKSTDTPSVQLIIDGVIIDIAKGSDAATVTITADVSAAEILTPSDRTFGTDVARTFTMNGKTLTFTLKYKTLSFTLN